jgi:hypothetical protein
MEISLNPDFASVWQVSTMVPTLLVPATYWAWGQFRCVCGRWWFVLLLAQVPVPGKWVALSERHAGAQTGLHVGTGLAALGKDAQ